MSRPTTFRRATPSVVLLALLAVCALPATPPARAAGAAIVVTTTRDEVTANGRCSLREAVISANTDSAVGGCEAGSGADTITFAAPAGVYAFSPHLAGNDDTAHLGDLDVTAPLTIEGRGPGATIIDARGLDRAFQLIGSAQARFPVTITGLTVTRGAAPSGAAGSGIDDFDVQLTLSHCMVSDNTGVSQSGTGLAITSGSPTTVDGCTFANNESQRGGAIGTNSDLDVTDSVFTGNDADGGGALYVNGGTTTVEGSLFQDNASSNTGGAIWNAATLVLRDSSLIGNHADNEGGALLNSFHGGTLDDVTLEGNSAPSGGAIYNDRASLVVRGAEIDGNSGGHGGGVFASGFGNPLPTVDIERTVFDGNTATAQGGALFTFGDDTLQGDTFSNNEAGTTTSPPAGAGDGDAIYSQYDPDELSAVLSITNSTIADNGTQLLQGDGGGLRNNNAIVELRSDTFDGNAGDSQAGSGGSISNDVSMSGSITSVDSIFADPLTGGNCGGTRPTSQGHNLEFGTGIGNEPCLGNPADPTDQNADPMLGPLQDNGGPTPTMALGAGSAALGQGAGCPAADQRGVPRGAACEVGAYQRVLCGGVPVDVVGTSGADVIRGSTSADSILGLGGNDVIDGGPGNDLICAGPGADRIDGGPGGDVIDGGPGRDTATFADASHVTADLVAGTAKGAGADSLVSVENLAGSPGNDTLLGSGGPNRLVGGRGNDHLDGRGGRDTCVGGPGRDVAVRCEAVTGVP